MEVERVDPIERRQGLGERIVAAGIEEHEADARLSRHEVHHQVEVGGLEMQVGLVASCASTGISSLVADWIPWPA